jgi:DNA polymerase elongation subunit (family B)
MNSSKSEPQ